MVHRYYGVFLRSQRRWDLKALERAAPTQYVSPMEFALVYIALGDTERAFAMLDKAFGERNPWLSSLAADPAFDPLRADQRFRKLLSRLGLSDR
jgi:hypothetical protein